MVVRVGTFVLGLALAVALCAPAGAATLYATDSGASDPDGHLYAVDPATGATTDIGVLGWGVTGMAVDPTSGVLYGVTGAEFTGTVELITIDRTTGAGSLVAPLSIDPSQRVTDIAFTTGGQLYGLHKVDGSTSHLATINKADGTVTDLPATIQGGQGNGLTISYGGSFYRFPEGIDGGNMEVLDPSSGAVVSTTTLNGSGLDGNRIPAATIACDGNTVFLAIQSDMIATLDPSTGAISTPITLSPPFGSVGSIEGFAWDCGVLAPAAAVSGLPPIVSALSPAAGVPGTVVTIAGDHFETANQVLFGDLSAQFVVDGFRQITAIAPTGSGGVVDVRVISPYGTSTTSSADLFTYSGSTPTGPGAPGDQAPGGLPEQVLPPKPFLTGNVEPISGSVLVKLPGALRYVPLEQLTTIPVGSIIDARNGVVRLTVASDTQGHTQTGEFTGGIFRFSQRLQPRSKTRLITDLRLVGSFALCSTRAVGNGARRRVVRYLKAKASGKFNLVGRYASGIERGTTWRVIDTCSSTEVRVDVGTVSAFDRVKRKRFVVKPGGVYVARPRPRR